MTSPYISMLRGINVGGARKVAMPDLKALYETLGFANVRTYVQSGNVVFDNPRAEPLEAAALIEKAIEKRFGFSVPVFMRDAAGFQRLVESNPFSTVRQEDPAFLHVTFLYRQADPERLALLAGIPAAVDEFAPGLEEIFLFCPGGYGRTKLSNNAIESKLKVAATTRNWKTVLALLALAEETL